MWNVHHPSQIKRAGHLGEGAGRGASRRVGSTAHGALTDRESMEDFRRRVHCFQQLLKPKNTKRTDSSFAVFLRTKENLHNKTPLSWKCERILDGATVPYQEEVSPTIYRLSHQYRLHSVEEELSILFPFLTKI